MYNSDNQIYSKFINLIFRNFTVTMTKCLVVANKIVKQTIFYSKRPNTFCTHYKIYSF